MSAGTFAVVLIIGILLLLLMTRYRSIFFRQKNKEEADSRPQNVDFCELHSAEGLELPERVDGWLDLSGLTTVEGLKLPNHVGASLDLKGLTTAEGLEFPEHMGGWLDLEGLTTSRGLKLPKRVGGDLDLKGLTTAEGLEFPEYVGGWLDLRGLTTSRGLKLPEHVSGDIYFWSLPKSEYDRLSHGPVRMDGKVRFEPLVAPRAWYLRGDYYKEYLIEKREFLKEEESGGLKVLGNVVTVVFLTIIILSVLMAVLDSGR